MNHPLVEGLELAAAGVYRWTRGFEDIDVSDKATSSCMGPNYGPSSLCRTRLSKEVWPKCPRGGRTPMITLVLNFCRIRTTLSSPMVVSAGPKNFVTSQERGLSGPGENG